MFDKQTFWESMQQRMRHLSLENECFHPWLQTHKRGNLSDDEYFDQVVHTDCFYDYDLPGGLQNPEN